MTQSPRTGFGHDTTADEVLDGIDCSGKLALVTGASGGLGAETARALASRGAAVLITARDMGKGQGIVDEIRASTGNHDVDVAELDLASLASVRAFADRFSAEHDVLHLLINNAGVMACPHATTADGFEMQFGTNHVGHFLLTKLLTPALERGAPARIVNLSSRGHRLSPVVFDDVHFADREYDKWAAYGQSKTANVLHAVELDRRLGPKGVRAYAVHPGGIMTDLARHMTEEDFKPFREQQEAGILKLKTVEAGAATTAYAATAPELEGRGGVYLEDCQVAEINDDADFTTGVRSYALDPDNAQRLWALSEELVG